VVRAAALYHACRRARRAARRRHLHRDAQPGGSGAADARRLPGDRAERLVFTDAFTRAWEPSAKPFFTGILTLAEEGGKTRYTARARHWTREDCEAHEKMGFHEGWGLCAEQLAALAVKL
jgi:uncharacterized protein YndB with AHSA1/START domain